MSKTAKLWRVLFCGVFVTWISATLAPPAAADEEVKQSIERTFSPAHSAAVQFSDIEIELTSNPVDKSLIGIVTGVLAGEACVCNNAAWPLLSKLPYVGDTFKSVRHAPHCTTCENDADGFKCSPVQTELRVVQTPWNFIEQCSGEQPCRVRSCETKCCPDVAKCDVAKCDAAKCDKAQCQVARRPKACAESKPEKFKSAKSREKKSPKIDQQTLQLVAENAALQARMETRDELIDELLPLLEENARLKAAAEFGEQREQIIGQYLESQRQHASAIAQAAIENAKLKAQLEAAAAQQDVMSEFINTHKQYAQRLTEGHHHARPSQHPAHADPLRSELDQLRKHAAMLEAKIRELTHAAQRPIHPAYSDTDLSHGQTRVAPPAGTWVTPPATASEPQRHNPPTR